MNLRVLLLASIVVATGAARAEGASSLALLPIVAPDLGTAERAQLAALIRAELSVVPGIALQDDDVTQGNLATAKNVGAGCSFESLSCQANMGLVTGVDRAVIARASPSWSATLLELRLLDVVGASIERETMARLPKDAALLPTVLRGAVLRLLTPISTGALQIDGAARPTVFLDGVQLDPSATAQPVEGLAPGTHTVELRADERVLDTRTAVVTPATVVHVAFGAPGEEARRFPAEGGLRAGPIVVATGATVLALAGAGAGGLAWALEQPIERDTRTALRVTGLSLLATSAVGAAVTLAGVGVWIWEGP